jgi:hypothetical protein
LFLEAAHCCRSLFLEAWRVISHLLAGRNALESGVDSTFVLHCENLVRFRESMPDWKPFGSDFSFQAVNLVAESKPDTNNRWGLQLLRTSSCLVLRDGLWQYRTTRLLTPFWFRFG